MSPATLAMAASAKARLMVMLEGNPDVCAIGIAFLDGGFGVKVNLLRLAEQPIPEEIDGVPVIVELTGGISPL